MLGLSQLHQLRGRVGRGRERAYAYFLYPPEKPLTETAHDRLATIAPAHRARRRHVRGDEGPGDPRRRQPARRRAVRPHRGRRLRPVRPAGRRGGRRLQRASAPARSRADVKVELPVDAHLPHDYIPGERLRLEAYRKLAAAGLDERRREAVRDELADRYGELPEPVANLLAVARFRMLRPRATGSPRCRCRAASPLRAGGAARVAGAAAEAALPPGGLKGTVNTISVPRPRRPPGRGHGTGRHVPLRWTSARCWSGARGGARSAGASGEGRCGVAAAASAPSGATRRQWEAPARSRCRAARSA